MTGIYTPFLLSVVSCFIGFLIAWIMRSLTLRKKIKLLERKENVIKVIELKNEDLKEKLAFTSAQANGLKELTYEQNFKIEQLDADNKKYFQQLQSSNSIAFIEDDDSLDQVYDDTTVLSRIKRRKKDIPFDRLGYVSEFEKNDLKKINGIGHYIERKLNALGFFSFQQIAALTDEDIELVNKAIEFFPGQIIKDNWVGQAKLLM